MAIKKIQVFGERNSGTNYLTKLFQENYKGIKLVNEFGWKHGNLGDVMQFYDKKGNLVKPKPTKPTKTNTKDVLFVVIFRNPMTWLQSMHRSPHHAPKSWFTSMSDFLHIPWESYYSIPGQPSSQDEDYRMACVKKKNLHERFENIMKLRSEKVKTHLAFSKKVPNVCFINYENLMQRRQEILSDIANTYGIKQSNSIKDIKEDKFGDKVYKPKQYTPLSTKDLSYAVNQLDWDVENQIGYFLDRKMYGATIGKNPVSKFFKSKLQITNPNEIISSEFKPVFYKDGKEQRVKN